MTLVAGAAAALVLTGNRPLPARKADRRPGPAGFRLADLSPDRMWPVYRRYRLLILGQRNDSRGMALARAVAKTLAHFLPASRARSTRAPHARRVGVLIATDQFDVAIMAKESAEALMLGKPPFSDIGGAPLRAIVSFGSHLLVCRPDFFARHAYLLAKTLSEHGNTLPAPAGSPKGPVPAHRGSRAFFAGEEIPDE